ncbi:MAG: NUDIX domain-containing protein [Chloroflexi bacterium]|nr:NUDIX domain-containing protein [Chloroflexota bacterium]
MPKRPSVGIGVIITREDQVLLMKRQNSHGHGTWSPPGGHLEYGESFEECAIRETLEETGVVIANSTFLGVTNDCFNVQEKHYVTIWMEGKYVSGEPKINSEREMSEVGWFSWHSLPKPLFLPFENFLAGQRYPDTQFPLLLSDSI